MIDFTKPVQTRNGRKVTILSTTAPCVFLGDPQPIVGVVDEMNCPLSWSATGRYREVEDHEFDLINTPPLMVKTSEVFYLRLCRNNGETMLFHSKTNKGWGPYAENPIIEKTITIEYQIEVNP